MNHIKYYLAIITVLCAWSNADCKIPSVKHASDFKFKSLPAKDQLGLFLAYKLNPKSFEKMPKEILADIAEYADMPRIDNFFIDAKQLFVQASKIAQNATLPEFNWEETYEFCIWIWCISIRLEYETKNTSFIGGETIHSSTEVTPTSIQHSIDIPLFNWTSPGFRVTLVDAESLSYFENCHYSFENVSYAFRSDYHFVPNVGIQLANMSIHFNADRVRGGLNEVSYWDNEGNLIEKYFLDPTAYEMEESMMSTWASRKREYTSGLEYSLNCFLSNGRSDPVNCLEDGGWDDNEDVDGKYYHLLNMQFIQTIGLSALVTG